MLKVGQVKEIYEKKGAGRSIRGIAEDLGIARNTVRRYPIPSWNSIGKGSAFPVSRMAAAQPLWGRGCVSVELFLPRSSYLSSSKTFFLASRWANYLMSS